MKHISKFILIISFCFSVTSSFAWGKKGNDIVAEIAFHYLESTDKAKIMSY